ncbi:FlhB Flagellar biosynthesis pathway, component FlhB [Burkholderiaceae bacterium]|jgi:flagellar biosynthetic protein FlhB|nr:flagellar biosynthesis protein FlhB [Limnohabitans sp.]MBP8021557.1 flagellar biosynthesis protein FlhB [Limnohabitans sp.]
MADDSSERTEEPTEQRLRKAREEGQVARSVELSTAAILVAATLFFSLSGSYLFHRLGALFINQLQFDRKVMDKAELLPAIFFQSIIDGFVMILPIMVLLAVVALLSTVMSGGLIFSPKMMLPKFSKLDPMAGLARMFGLKALIELCKTFLKFLVISLILWMAITNNIEDLVTLNRMDLGTAISHAGTMILDACFWMSMGLVVIAIADVPLQHYQVNKKLKMTRQEIKDEMKNAEGRPEVKATIRRRQREMANNRMMDNVKDADVVITNPQHFAVALSYDPNSDGAPTLVAKGTDELAKRIRERAKENNVYIFEAPDLARALYFTTKLDHPIHEGLYHVVAQVIAYVFSLNQSYAPGEGLVKPTLRIPDNMRYDENGFLFQQ